MKKNAIPIILILFFFGCTLINEPEAYHYDTAKILSETTDLIKKEYPYITFKKLNIDSLNNYFCQNLQKYKGDKIYDLLNEYLYNLKDGHVWFYTIGGFEVHPYIPRRSIKDKYSYDPQVVREYFNSELKFDSNARIEYGINADNLGYVYISTMRNNGFNWIKEFTNIMNSLNQTDGLIVDVRDNGGGSDLITNYLISHFINMPITGPIWLDSSDNQLARQEIYPNNKIYYSNPVVLLQNGRCFSATEGFINVMREIPNITTIGDTTAGGSSAPKDFYISENITIHLSTKAQLTYNRKQIEWNGLVPDILVTQNITDLENGRDLQLEAAFKFLKNCK